MSDPVARCPLLNRKAIEVVVIDEADQPVKDVQLALLNGTLGLSTRTKPNGHVRFTGLEPGEYELVVPEWDEGGCVPAGSHPLTAERANGPGAAPWEATPELPQPCEGITAEEGQGIAEIAAKYGFLPKTVWEAEGNEGLRKKRRTMFVREGEHLSLPRRKARRVKVATGSFYYLRILGIPWFVRLRLLYENGKPRADEKYVALIQCKGGSGEGNVVRGQTDSDGLLVEPVPADCEFLEITIGKDDKQEVYQVGMREFEPADEPAGMQMRLAALGFYGGQIDGEIGPLTKEAIAAFQEDFDVPVTGECNSQTVAKLETVFGC